MVLSTPTIMGMILTFLFHIFFSSQTQSLYFSLLLMFIHPVGCWYEYTHNVVVSLFLYLGLSDPVLVSKFQSDFCSPVWSLVCTEIICYLHTSQFDCSIFCIFWGPICYLHWICALPSHLFLYRGSIYKFCEFCLFWFSSLDALVLCCNNEGLCFSFLVSSV